MLTSPTRAFPVDVLNCLIYCWVTKRTRGTGNLFFTPPPTPCKNCICEDLPQQSPTEANHTQLQEGFMIHTFSYCFRKFLSRAICFSSAKCRCSMNIDTMLTTIKRPAPHSVFFSFGVGCHSPTMLYLTILRSSCRNQSFCCASKGKGGAAKRVVAPIHLQDRCNMLNAICKRIATHPWFRTTLAELPKIVEQLNAGLLRRM